eukprot:COSAG01_NODE_6941_length_3429_cov_69.840841_5_plen_64_part_00
MSLSSSSRMSMVGRKLLAVFYLRQYKKIVEKKLIDRPHASLLATAAWLAAVHGAWPGCYQYQR